MDQTDLWPSGEQGQLTFQLVRVPDIVAVEKSNERRLARGDADVSRPCGAAVFAADDMKPGPSPGIVSKYRGRLIGRTIIDHDDGVRLQGLRPHAVQASLDQT